MWSGGVQTPQGGLQQLEGGASPVEGLTRSERVAFLERTNGSSNALSRVRENVTTLGGGGGSEVDRLKDEYGKLKHLLSPQLDLLPGTASRLWRLVVRGYSTTRLEGHLRGDWQKAWYSNQGPAYFINSAERELDREDAKRAQGHPWSEDSGE